jgi:hypothetical protein
MHQHKLAADGIERIFGNARAWASRTSNVAAMLRLMARRVAPAIKGGEVKGVGAHATADV